MFLDKIKAIKIFFIIMIAAIVFLLFKDFLPLLSLLEEYGIAVQALSTVVLTIITLVYAFYTKEISEQTKKQIISDIKVDIKKNEKGFSKDILLIEKDDYFTMDLILEIYNNNSASGSITTPELILSFEGKELLRLKGTIVHDTDNGVIFVRGGEIKRINIFYTYSFGQNSDWESVLSELKKLKVGFKNLDYCFVYKNNLGNTYNKKID
ncbi:MAG: hypothetical protein WCS56_05540 [Bacilli bacterium]